MEMNNKVTRHKYGHRGLNEFNSVNESVAKREFYNNRVKKEQEALLESQNIRESELNRQSALLENINNRKINEIKMAKTKNLLYEVTMDKLVKVAFTEAFKESLYLDEDYKIDNSEKLVSVIESFVDENGGYKLLENAVKQNKDSLFLKSVYEACKSRAEKITREKCKEAGDQPEKLNFDVRLDELDEFKEDLSKTNIDTLGEIVKNKVLNTVIEEKERSIKKQEFEEDIKNEVDGVVTESLKYKIHSKNIIEQPSLFSAMMRKSYSNMLEESVAIIQTYNPNDKLSEIGLDETEVDYNDKNEHSLSHIEDEKLVTIKSMKPENKSDDFSSGNPTFDNSALATLDDDSDDIDMFTLTNESVVKSEINELDNTESNDKKPVNLWSKFVNTEVERSENNNNGEEDHQSDSTDEQPKNNVDNTNQVTDTEDENLYESVLDEYESVLESEDELDVLEVMEAAVDSMEFDEEGTLYEELMISDDFIRNSVEKMSDKELQNHLPKLEKMIKDLTEELKVAKDGQIPALANSAVGPIRKFLVKLNVKLAGLTPEKAAKNIQEMITIGKKEISFVKAELKKRGLKAVSESFTSVLDDYNYLSENFSIMEETEIDENSPEFIAIESIAKLGNDNNLRIDQRRRVVRLCESLSIGELADLTAKYRNEAIYLNENITKLSNMNEMDKAVYVYEASIGKEGYNFNDELSELKKNIEYCNEQVGLFNIAAKILITLESLGLTEACKKGKIGRVCSECGAELLQGSNCLDCGASKLDKLPDVVKESIMNNEESNKPCAEVFMDKVLCEALIQYTLLEMMHTAKVLNYTNSDVKKMALEMNK